MVAATVRLLFEHLPSREITVDLESSSIQTDEEKKINIKKLVELKFQDISVLDVERAPSSEVLFFVFASGVLFDPPISLLY